jgi:antitoxin ParD1/3/4
MTITLTSDQQAWLEAHVARGDYASVEEAVRQLIDERIAEAASIDSDDLAWAKSLVEEAAADLAARGEMTLDEHLARLDAIIAAKTHR